MRNVFLVPVRISAATAPVNYYIKHVKTAVLLRCDRALQCFAQVAGTTNLFAIVAVSPGDTDMIDLRVFETDADVVTRFCGTALQPCKRPAVGLITQVVENHNYEWYCESFRSP